MILNAQPLSKLDRAGVKTSLIIQSSRMAIRLNPNDILNIFSLNLNQRTCFQ